MSFFTTHLSFFHSDGERIFKIGEHLAKSQAKWLTVSYTPFTLHFCPQRCRSRQISWITCAWQTETVIKRCYVVVCCIMKNESHEALHAGRLPVFWCFLFYLQNSFGKWIHCKDGYYKYIINRPPNEKITQHIVTARLPSPMFTDFLKPLPHCIVVLVINQMAGKVKYIGRVVKRYFCLACVSISYCYCRNLTSLSSSSQWRINHRTGVVGGGQSPPVRGPVKYYWTYI